MFQEKMYGHGLRSTRSLARTYGCRNIARGSGNKAGAGADDLIIHNEELYVRIIHRNIILISYRYENKIFMVCSFSAPVCRLRKGA